MDNVIDCKNYKQCGSCKYALSKYKDSLKAKQEQMNHLFKGYTVKPIIGMDDPYGYRHKVTVTFTKVKGKISAGVYEESSHKVVPTTTCALHHPLANKIIETVIKLANEFNYTVYNENNHTGQLRHLQIRISTDNHALVTFVLGTFVLKSSRQFFAKLKDNVPEIVSIVENLNTKHTSMILGDKSKVVLGKGFVVDQMNDLSFQISSKSFYQVNPSQALICYNLAIDGLHLTKTDTVLDAYCGIGTLASFACNKAKKAIGVELNKVAIIDAKKNATLNHLSNVEFYARNVDNYVLNTHFDCIIVDPPRSGCSKTFIEAMVHNNPRAIAYISCNPSTQARDIKMLEKYGYKAKYIQPVDMFPFTEHVETVCLMFK